MPGEGREGYASSRASLTSALISTPVSERCAMPHAVKTASWQLKHIMVAATIRVTDKASVSRASQ